MDASDDGDILFSVSHHVARITLNRPDRGNSLIPAMMPMLRDIWSRINDDPEIRCVLLTASGDRFFCTGADLEAVSATGSVGVGGAGADEDLSLTSRQNQVWKPTVCAVNGVVTGAGLHFVVDADIVVASTNAQFLDSHVNVGMVGGVENVGLAKRLPIGTALRMTLQGKKFRLSAERAFALGLVDELTTPEALLATATDIAGDIAENSPRAVSLSQQAIWNALELPYSEAIEHSYQLVTSHWSHPDFVEGPRAFAERRPPQWTPEPTAGPT